MSRGQNVAVWVISVLSALVMLLAGGGKLLALPPNPENFVRWGFPPWFLFVAGVMEVGGAVLMLIPRTAAVGALVLLATMLGAVGTHLKAGELPMIGAPLVLAVLDAIVLAARRDRLLQLLGRAPGGGA